MAKFIKGDVVIVPFPFSDLTASKRRPALVISALAGDDIILCQITSQAIKDQHAISINDGDFDEGSLRQPSNARPNRLFTADSRIVLYRIGKLQGKKINEVIDKVVEIIRGPQ
jgi:mRNA interferase MazF